MTPARLPGDLATALTATAAQRPGAAALLDGTEAWTFAEFLRLSDATAAALRAGGVGPTDRVAVLSRSSAAVLATVVAATRLGAVTVPVNWRLSISEIAGVLADAGAQVTLADAGFVAELRRRPGVDLTSVIALGDGLGRFDELLSVAGHSATPLPDRRPSAGDAVLQIYTSGTSGRPKGVVLTAANLDHKWAAMKDEWGFSHVSVSLLATPLFHVGGLVWALVGLVAGARLIVPATSGAPELAHAVARHRVTHAFLVPKLLDELVRQVDAEAEAVSSVEVVLCGAATVGVELQRRAIDVLGCRLLQVYGLTETTGSITQLDVRTALTSTEPSLRSVGTPFPWVELEIRDPDSRTPLPAGEHGEIWTRSRQNCTGYWNRPDATAALVEDGWLRTGDGGYVDDTGRLYLTDRIKDMIISGGENIYSAEVERVLAQLPAVRDVAVVGRPDEEWGETVVAVVELHQGRELLLDDVAEHVGHVLGRYKRPRDLVVVDRLPRNASGKVLKREVRQLASSRPKGVR